MSARFIVEDGGQALVYEEERERALPDGNDRRFAYIPNFRKVGDATPEDLATLPKFEDYLKALKI